MAINLTKYPKTKQLIDFVQLNWDRVTGDKWSQEGARVFQEFLDAGERYGKAAAKQVLVYPSSENTKLPEKCPFVALTMAGASKPAYAGTSLVLFPSKSGKSLVTLCLGTKGLGADAVAVGLPGHARRLTAIRSYVNKEIANGSMWVKKNPCKIEQFDKITTDWIATATNGESFGPMIKTYGQYVYAVLDVSKFTNDDDLIRAFVMIFDLYMAVRGVEPLSDLQKENTMGRNVLQTAYERYIFASVDDVTIKADLEEKHYLIIEGPPGTGKTRVAEVWKKKYEKDYGPGSSMTIQFHPNMTYEQFIGGIFPEKVDEKTSGLGFRFSAKPGYLMRAAKKARDLGDSKKFLLHIDEINRADLSRVLGEAVYLLEVDADKGVGARRKINLDHDFGDWCEKDGDQPVFSIPDNLYIIGTMNSSDRSIAPIDIAIRRRFAFERLYPQIGVIVDIPVASGGQKQTSAVFSDEAEKQFAIKAFQDLIGIFIDYATEESFNYIPGHSYFLPDKNGKVKNRIRTGVLPLLREYLDKGMVSSMATMVENYIMTYEALVRV